MNTINVTRKMFGDIPFIKINDKKNKKIYLRLVFINEYTKDNITEYSLLCNLLSNSSKVYNTKRKICEKICDLYDANIYFSTRSFYKARVSIVDLNFVSPYLLEKELLEDAIDFMLSFLLKPNIKNKAFDLKSFNEEKINLKSDIEKTYNQVEQYAFSQFIKEMAKDELVSYNAEGNLEALENITPKSLYQTYLDLINNSEKMIFLLGDIDNINVDIIENKLKPILKLPNIKQNLEFIMEENIYPKSIKDITKKRKVSQSRLIFGYRTDISIKNKLYYSYQLFIRMFGSLSTSTLFEDVREKQGLCYEIYASSIDNAKIMTVELGLDLVNKEKAYKSIINDMKSYKEGMISPKLLDNAKLDLITSLESLTDNAYDMLDFELDNELIGYENQLMNIKNIINKINEITVNDIKEVSNHLFLDTVFLLEGSKDE